MLKAWEYHGIHAASGLPRFAPVEWYPSVPRAERVRVQAHTCECSPIVYELCTAGGLFFVRRRDRSGPRPILTESEWVIKRRAEVLWLRILNGGAR
ncbi:hypothetical protein [Nonomuraea africana]|uniref:Uncharacterized protein n=1 Tax=Nonomuraea africana TaxID=46171 RepID=A0ABR9KQZ2_9ACTN|nr:hypothetical protein [Nonomuraea africana]MBE1564444.1 hypothetical protein [Nonomuraea africana]